MIPLSILLAFALCILVVMAYYMGEMKKYIQVLKNSKAPQTAGQVFLPTEKESEFESPPSPPLPDFQAQGVGQFYDEQTANFIQVYGEVIQAFRTHNLENLLNSQIKSMDLKKGQKVLDAGCGICGPAIHFARKAGVQVDALTISRVQFEMARDRIRSAGLEDQIQVHHGDYHNMDGLFPPNSYDVVYFLESFGHSHDKFALLDAVWKVLKPGGSVYIKDLFIREAILPGHKEVIDREIRKINQAYHYHIADLCKILSYVRRKGYILGALKTIDIPLEDFENLTISNDFQELTGIARIDNWDTYIFPIDFFELILYKPENDIAVGNSRYFLQNMYYMQVHGRGEETL